MTSEKRLFQRPLKILLTQKNFITYNIIVAELERILSFASSYKEVNSVREKVMEGSLSVFKG